jgi:hypothetical protein
MQLERHQWIWQLSKELLQQRSELHWVVLGQIDRRRVSVNGVRQISQSADIAILPEYTLNRHIYMTEKMDSRIRSLRF